MPKSNKINLPKYLNLTNRLCPSNKCIKPLKTGLYEDQDDPECLILYINHNKIDASYKNVKIRENKST